jgi:uncharacterized Zn finger protein
MKQRDSKRTAQKRSQTDLLIDLTWDDLQKWAGAAILSRGQRYQRNGQVHTLARTSLGGLVAWVQGTRRYATTIESEGKALVAACTCPYEGICKHAVAVVLDYLEQVKQNRAIPTVTEQDQRLRLLEGPADVEETDEEGEGDEADEEVGRAVLRRSRAHDAGALPEFLEQQTKPQLLALLKDMAQRYPDVRQSLQDRHSLSVGAVPKLVKALRAEIAVLSEEPGWSNHWNNEGSIPDYSRVRDRLEALLAKGHADAVVDVGAELLEAGTRQVEMSHDEGETGEEVASCLDVVFRALSHSSRSPAEQMRWVVEAELSDDYELCRGAKAFWDKSHPTEAWNALAEHLVSRLVKMGTGTSPAAGASPHFSDNYRRDRLSNWLILSLERAGRHEEIIPLCRQEAERTGSYLRLVEQLKKAKQWEEAEQWIRKGIAATEKRWPGIASQLRASFIEMRKGARDWTRVAALHADDFFAEPSLKTFQTLQQAAKRAGVLPAVRAAALHYLETGAVPQPTARMAGAQTVPPWPLPDGGLKPAIERPVTHPPMTDTLIDIAIAEKRPDDVLRWYDQRKPRPRGWDYGWFAEDRIAEAVMEAYPDRAVAIWQHLAEKQIALTKPKAYEEAAGYLRKVHRIQKQLGKEQEWQSYLASLRRTNERKRRLVQILDTLSGRRIIESS